MIMQFIAATVIAAGTLTSGGSFSWVCPTLDANPTTAGVWDVLAEAVDRGLTSEADAEEIALQVINYCPEYIPIVKQWAEANG